MLKNIQNVISQWLLTIQNQSQGQSIRAGNGPFSFFFNHSNQAINLFQIIELYNMCPITRRIVDDVANEATREWRKWNVTSKSKENIEKDIMKFEDRLDVRDKVRQALVYSNLYGGSVIIIQTNGQLPNEPLKVENEKDVLALRVYTQEFLKIETDEKTKEEYVILSLKDVTIKAHKSRCLFFKGDYYDKNYVYSNLINVFGELGVSKVYKSLKTLYLLYMVEEVLLRYLNKPNIDVFKLDYNYYFEKGISSEDLTAKVKELNMLMGGDDAIQVGLNDSYETIFKDFSALISSLDYLKERLSADSSIPVGRLFGSNQGFLSSNEDEAKKYYEFIARYQNSVISQALRPLDDLIEKLFERENDDLITFEWKSLLIQTEQEKVDFAKSLLDLYSSAISSELISSDEARKFLSSNPYFTGIENKKTSDERESDKLKSLKVEFLDDEKDL